MQAWNESPPGIPSRPSLLSTYALKSTTPVPLSTTDKHMYYQTAIIVTIDSEFQLVVIALGVSSAIVDANVP